MRVAVIGSRTLSVEHLDLYLPKETSLILSGGAVGVDSCARIYALRHGIPLKEYLPDYRRCGRRAPLERNLLIIQNADLVLDFWDGRSRGTAFVIRSCKKMNVPVHVYLPDHCVQ